MYKINDLPKDVLYNIFSFFSQAELIRVKRTCTVFKECADELLTEFDNRYLKGTIQKISYSQDSFDDIVENSPFSEILTFSLNNKIISLDEFFQINFQLFNWRDTQSCPIVRYEHNTSRGIIDRSSTNSMAIFGVILHLKLIPLQQLACAIEENFTSLHYILTDKEFLIVLSKKLMTFEEITKVKDRKELMGLIKSYSLCNEIECNNNL